jgi:hypothetical protein
MEVLMENYIGIDISRSHFPRGNAYKPNPKQNYHKITNGKKN